MTERKKLIIHGTMLEVLFDRRVYTANSLG